MFESLEDKPVEEKPADYTGIVIFFALVPVYLLFRHFGRVDLALSTAICLAMTGVVIRIRRDLLSRWWFWVVILIVLALHVPLILIVRWPHEWFPKVALLPIGLVDCLVILGIIKLVEKFIVRAVPANDED